MTEIRRKYPSARENGRKLRPLLDLSEVKVFIDKTVGETGRPITVGQIAAEFHFSRQAAFTRVEALRKEGYLAPQEKNVAGQLPAWAATAIKAAYALNTANPVRPGYERIVKVSTVLKLPEGILESVRA